MACLFCTDAWIIGLTNHEYTIRPWVRNGLSVLPILGNASNIAAPAITTPSTAVFGATIRVVESSLDSGSIYSSRGFETLRGRKSPAPSDRDASTPTPTLNGVPSDRDAPTPTLTGRLSRTPKSLSFGGRGKTTPPRHRGMTVPADWRPRTPERRDTDRDSVVSFTPSISSKHLANWFSGLLGR
jgi:hypothetical protein